MPIKDKLFSVFFCFYLFWYPLACIVLGEQQQAVDGFFMRVFLISIFVISSIFYLSYRKRAKELYVWGVVVTFGMALCATQFFYSFHSSGYDGIILRWGSDCVSACMIGMTLMKLKSYATINKMLPIVVIVVTVFLVPETFKNAMLAGQMHLDNGMNYQTMAYTMALLFCLSLYYGYINNESISGLARLIFTISMPVQAVACCMSGGRGGVVLLSVYIVAMSYIMLKLRKIGKFQLVLLILVGVVVFFTVANYFNLWESAGFSRSSNLMKDDDRFDLWNSIWHFVEDNDYMGYGIGGDYFTYGFYTHNIFLDFILEAGIIGAVFFTAVFVSIYRSIYRRLATENIFIILMIVGLFGLVMNLFSGYWITTYSHWMALGVALTCSFRFKMNAKLGDNPQPINFRTT